MQIKKKSLNLREQEMKTNKFRTYKIKQLNKINFVHWAKNQFIFVSLSGLKLVSNINNEKEKKICSHLSILAFLHKFIYFLFLSF